MRGIIAIFVLMAITLAACAQPPEDVVRAETPTGDVIDTDMSDAAERPIDVAASTFTFTGYAPGKDHTGTFEEMEGVLLFEEGAIVGARGVIQASSVKSDSERLDGHLMNEDFFNVEIYPEITMESTSIANGELTGTLTFHGVSQDLTFPVTVTENSISADTIISMEDFGISYTGVNDEVRIQFTMVA